MTQNTTINATVNAAANVAEKKEENVMMNLTQKELEAMKVVELKDLAQQRGLTFTSKTKKAELVAMLKLYTTGTPSQYRKGEVDHIVVETTKLTRLEVAVVIAWMYQSVTNVLKTKTPMYLFYEATKRTDLGKVKISSRKKLVKVTGDLIARMYGSDKNTYENIQKVFDTMVDKGYCHRNGDDIHMTVEEWAKSGTLYMDPKYAELRKQYAQFVATKVNNK